MLMLLRPDEGVKTGRPARQGLHEVLGRDHPFVEDVDRRVSLAHSQVAVWHEQDMSAGNRPRPAHALEVAIASKLSADLGSATQAPPSGSVTYPLSMRIPLVGRRRNGQVPVEAAAQRWPRRGVTASPAPARNARPPGSRVGC